MRSPRAVFGTGSARRQSHRSVLRSRMMAVATVRPLRTTYSRSGARSQARTSSLATVEPLKVTNDVSLYMGLMFQRTPESMRYIYPKTPASALLAWLDSTPMSVRFTLLRGLVTQANHATGGIVQADDFRSRRHAVAFWLIRRRRNDACVEKIRLACAYVDAMMVERGLPDLWRGEIARCTAAGNLDSVRRLGALSKAWMTADSSWSEIRASSLAPKRLRGWERKQRVFFPVRP